MPGALGRPTMSPSSPVLLRSWLYHAAAQRPGLHKLCVTQGFGIADPFADDLSTGQGIVLGRAATKLRSIEIQPLTGGSTGHRLVNPRNQQSRCLMLMQCPVSSERLNWLGAVRRHDLGHTHTHTHFSSAQRHEVVVVVVVVYRLAMIPLLRRSRRAQQGAHGWGEGCLERLSSPGCVVFLLRLLSFFLRPEMLWPQTIAISVE